MKKIVSVIMGLAVSVVSAQSVKNKDNTPQKARKHSVYTATEFEADRIFNKLVEVRRNLHENPELAGHEEHTQKLLKQYLLDLGLEVQTDIYGYGVIGILKGDKKGKKIAWRSDMDALPNDFPGETAFLSKTKGIGHGCGHDLHMAIGLGIAEVLAKNKDLLKGTVYFIFQPEEETFVGAKEMINNGLLSRIHPDEIYGLHVSALPVGQIMVRPNEMFAYQKRIRIQLKNELSKEDIKDLTKKIRNSLVRTAKGSKPWEIQQMSNPEMGLTNPNTMFKDYLIMDEEFNAYSKNNQFYLETYLYETDSSRVKDIIPKVKKELENSGYKDQLLSVSFSQENPTVINDEKLTNSAIKSLESVYGKNVITPDYGQVPYFNDDFAYFQQKIPGVYFFLGGSNIEKGMNAMNHTPNFRADEESIRTGVKYFSSLILEQLNNH